MTAKHEKMNQRFVGTMKLQGYQNHNNANVLSLPSRFISLEEALEIVKTFINTEFEEEDI